MTRCPDCGTLGDHYCPADVDTYDTDPKDETNPKYKETKNGN